MKIDDNSPAVRAAQAAKALEARGKSDTGSKEPSKSFAKVLAEKKEGAAPAGPTAEVQSGAAPMPAAAQRGPEIATTEVSAAHAVNVPDQLKGIVDEITVALPQSGPQHVEIQLNSKTLQGLKINITRDQGQVNIQFQTQSPQVASMLEQNQGSLQQALADRNVRVGSVRVAGGSGAGKYQAPAGRRR
jgi:flagellar hook-length control protein FliK